MCELRGKPSVEVNDRSWTESLLTGTTSQTSPFHRRYQRAEWDMEFHWEKKKKRKKKAREHCGAIMRADCEVRVGTVSEGMSRLARLVLLQRRGCMFERIHLRIEISCRRVIPLSVRREVNKSPGQCFCPKVSHSPQEAKEAYHTRQSKPDTWGKQRC